jgi:TIR domain
MKVFISWSGGVSHRVAVALRDWLPYVLQSVDPYVSSEDIEKGARWSNEVGRELESTSYGILCVTRENLDSRWLNFEAGALSKSMDLPRRNLDAGLAGGRLSRSGTVRISSYFRTL